MCCLCGIGNVPNGVKAKLYPRVKYIYCYCPAGIAMLKGHKLDALIKGEPFRNKLNELFR